MKLTPALLAALALSLLAALGAAGAGAANPTYPARTMKAAGFGTVLASSNLQALYYWSKEPKGTIRCTGSCAKLWPPLIVPKGTSVPRTRPGIKGTFGTIRRPDGRRQLTHNGRAVYSYVHEGPRKVLCDDVDGWFVVRV
jgi:predicted lipoprotein with Yx(FWY)xxD motif